MIRHSCGARLLLVAATLLFGGCLPSHSLVAELSTVQAFNRFSKRNDNFVTWSVNGGFLF